MDSDFPRVPFTNEKELFTKLCNLGARLSSIHRNPRVSTSNSKVKFVNGGDLKVTKVGEKGKNLANVSEGLGRLYINKVSFFEGVPVNAWNRIIGTYQVCHKWLEEKKRNNILLNIEHQDFFLRMVDTINETGLIQSRIGEVIEKSGGWPTSTISGLSMAGKTDPSQMS